MNECESRHCKHIWRNGMKVHRYCINSRNSHARTHTHNKVYNVLWQRVFDVSYNFVVARHEECVCIVCPVVVIVIRIQIGSLIFSTFLFSIHISSHSNLSHSLSRCVFASFNFTMACVNIIFPNRIQRLEVFAYRV